MMKVFWVCILWSIQCWSQASGSSEFAFTLLFDWKFPVDKIKLYVHEKNGNSLENVLCLTDKETPDSAFYDKKQQKLNNF